MKTYVTFTTCLVILLFTIACSKRSSTELIDSIRSGQSKEQVRDTLTNRISNWTESVDSLAPADKRPKRDFVTVRGDYESLSCRGQVKLVFFNNRLMSTEFYPANPECYFDALKKAGHVIPAKPNLASRISAATDFSYYLDPSVRFLWEDSTLLKEWNDWVRKYS